MADHDPGAPRLLGRAGRRRVPAAVVALALSVALLGAACGQEGGDSASTGTTLKGEERCPAVPVGEQGADGLEPLHAFGGRDGANPWGSLTLWEGRLYGRTRVGGESDNGVIFSMALDGSDYRVLHSFTAGAGNGEGNQPHHDSMLPIDGLLYSNTLLGGTGDHGVLFTVDPSGAGYRVLHAYAGAPGDGSQSHSGFLSAPDGLWILSSKGGSAGRGALLLVDAESGSTELAHSFATETGDEPHGRLVVGPDGSTLYGMTRMGGSADAGVIFSFHPGSRTYEVVHEFGPGPSNGEQPDHGFLVVVDGRLWGLATFGGVEGKGVAFSVAPDGSDFRVHHAFGADDDGVLPHGSLAQSGDWLYGLTFEGGRHGVGTVFRLSTEGEGYEVLASFGGSETGGYPYDNVVVSEDGHHLYGMTGNGGSNDPTCERALGTIFRLPLADP